MNGLALVIGNANYALKKNRLTNAVNDAKDVSEKLLRLGFHVITRVNCTQEQFDSATGEFQKELASYDVGLFYYCGHGLQIDGVNYLTSIDSNLYDEYSVTRNTMTLDEMIKRMHGSGVKTKIIVLDACRDNPLKTRGSSTPGLAPVHAPKGTIIAFSTSPGETAMDGGGASGKNSIYTSAFLNHIDDVEIPIEEFFKRVRHSVYALSNEKQTTWEHTSLIGEFSFNSGQLIHSIDLPYTEETIADSDFVSSGSEFDEIINDLKSYVYTTQNNALGRLRGVDASTLSISEQFLLGRNVLQVSCDTSYAAERIMKYLDTWLDRFFIGDENHVLNGMLYEMYFNSKGKFRADKIKSNRIEELLALQLYIKYKASFDLIRDQLRLFRKKLFYVPSPNPKSVAIEIKFDEMTVNFRKKTEKRLQIRSIAFKGNEIYRHWDDDDSPSSVTYLEFKDKLKYILAVPGKLLKISSNVSVQEESKIFFPYTFSLRID